MTDLQEIEKTLRERYDFFISCINNVWKLEKEKFALRIKWHDVDRDIADGLRVPPHDLSDYKKSLAAGVAGSKETLQTIENSINKIREKQIQELDQIKLIL